MRHTWLLALLLAVASPGLSQIARDDVPEPLRPWIDWVLQDHEDERCPFFQGSEDRRECTWPSRLSLELDDRSGRFTQEWLSSRETWAPLPGDAGAWPLDVRIDGREAVVVAREGGPAVLLPAGRHTVGGGFAWSALPPLLQVPRSTGLLRLTLRGVLVPFPRVDEQGRVWTERPAGEGAEEDRLDLTVLRDLADGVPLWLTTRIDLAVSGESREELLGRVLPDGFVPVSLSGPLPVRLEADGRLRVQLRPGRFTLELVARHEGPAGSIVLPAPGGPWDDEEIWVFEARPELRLVTIENVPGIDPQQTTLPPEWARFPAFLLRAGARMELVESRRGDADPAPDQLTLERTIWLDFDGGGATVHDVIQGTMSRSWRLAMQPPAVLGRVSIDGQDQFITRVEEAGEAGVEIRQGTLTLEADSRLEGRTRRFPAVGWDEDFQQVSGTLHLGPGWRLFHASGVDSVSTTWISSWTLLDIFLVLILTLSVGHLWGARAAALALATLVLTWTEPGAPHWSWLPVVAAEALRRALPEGGVRSAVRLVRGGALLILALVAVWFLIGQVRAAIYPALERPGAESRASRGRAAAPPAGEVLYDEVESLAQRLVPSSAPKRGSSIANVLIHDPGTVVQTGPGVPDWTWRRVSLVWRGPVEREQSLRLILIPPRLHSMLSFLRVGLVLLLGLFVAGLGGDRWRSLLPRGRVPVSPPPGAAALLLFGLLIASFPGDVRADLPSPELLDQLRQRLLEPPDCFPECASSPRLRLEVGRGLMSARLEILTAADTAVPLPGGPDGWPERVTLDGRPAPGLSRDEAGRLWMLLDPGAHDVVMEGRLPDRDTVELALPLRPHRVDARAEGWRVIGLSRNGVPEEALQLLRDAAPDAGPRALEPATLPPFARVDREIELALRWRVRTRVVRLSPPGATAVFEVPLLPGESVTTAGIQVREGRALVSLGPGAMEATWESTLEEGPQIDLRAPEEVPWTESWRLLVGATWHVEVDGIPAVHQPGEEVRSRLFRPWPGETVLVRIRRPQGIPGRTLTIDRSVLQVSPGLRATDATLDLSIRSSRGGEHVLTLPEGAVLQSVAVDGRPLPVRQEARSVSLPIAPGAQLVQAVWREPRGMTWWFRGPEVGLGDDSVNSGVHLALPADRWTLFVSGPRLGPAVIFWSFLAVTFLLSLLLGRSRLTELRWYHWFLLSLGLTQIPLPVALIVVVWLFALGVRRERGAAARPGWFDLFQLILAGLTFLALLVLFWSVQTGLLGYPEMQIVGNGSSSGMLRWYADRVGPVLPRPWVLSAPLLVYRLAMLAWALWLSVALLRWLRWGWRCFSEGGLWKPLRPAPPPPPVPPFPPIPPARSG